MNRTHIIVAAAGVALTAAVAVPAVTAARAAPAGGKCHTLLCQEHYLYGYVFHSRHPVATYKALSKANKKIYGMAVHPKGKPKVTRNRNKNVPPPAAPADAPGSHKGWRCAEQFGWLRWHSDISSDAADTWLNMERCWKNGHIVYNVRLHDGEGGIPHLLLMWFAGIVSSNNNGTGWTVADQIQESAFSVGPIKEIAYTQDVCMQDSGPIFPDGTIVLPSCHLVCNDPGCQSRPLAARALLAVTGRKP